MTVMDYSVPTNWQPDLVPALAGLKVRELYGQLPRDFVGGGRAPYLIGRVTRRRLRRHVADAHRGGIRFNYTLNATSMGNREWSIGGQRQLARLVDFLADVEIDSITVAIPYVLEYVKRRVPSMEVTVSTQAIVASPDRARRWEDLGADGITLSVLDVQRDFAILAAIREAVNIPLQLIGNLTCIQGCPAGHYHANLNAHASQTGQSRFVIDYCTIECNRQRIAHPDEFVRSGWIRPEDVHHYEKVGVDRIKLVTRGMRTDALVPIVQAYGERRSPPDLMDLLPTPDKSLVFSKPSLMHKVRHFAHPHRVNLWRLSRMAGLLQQRRITIDSAALGEDFLEPFLRGACATGSCQSCGHCLEVARRAVRIDGTYQATALENHRTAADEILSGRLFRWW